MDIRTIGVVGAGQMGSGIAQVAAQAGYSVILFDLSDSVLEKANKRIEGSLDRLIKKGTLTDGEKQTILGRLKKTAQLADLKNANMVVEAATENVDLKLKIFKDLDQITSKDCLLCTNTSSISITKIAAVTQRPEKVAGMHFMNPVPVMKLVEGIRGLQTSPDTFQAVRSVAEKMGKVFVEANDQPGFIVNRILMPMINEAVYTLYEGIGTKESIDEAMKLGTNQPMGPLTLADFIGLDTCLAILEVLHEGHGDPKYRPCPLLKKYVEAGWLGTKTGRGFYTYPAK